LAISLILLFDGGALPPPFFRQFSRSTKYCALQYFCALHQNFPQAVNQTPKFGLNGTAGFWTFSLPAFINKVLMHGAAARDR